MRNDAVLFGNRRHRIADRVELLSPLLLKVNTFGVPEKFKMLAKNLSMSGLLISSPNSRSLPFHVNTIIEIAVDIKVREEGTGLLNIIGKVVRKFNRDGEQLLGVQIISTDEVSVKEWCDMVDFLLNHPSRKVS